MELATLFSFSVVSRSRVVRGWWKSEWILRVSLFTLVDLSRVGLAGTARTGYLLVSCAGVCCMISAVS